MNRRLFLLAGLASAGCATVPPTLLPWTPGETLAELEPLYDVVADRRGLRLIVASQGCTGRADWTFYAEPRPGGVALAFARRRLDPCRAPAGGRAELLFRWEELGLPPRARVAIVNPIGAP
ncbi:hypothetical protein [Phenylobacterium sp.]|jgi:hypothetical protein|uniref:hypothetical protein n=1 Tax=Phenylobacterium sp. TaxID=1871053 RepID=UPI002F93DEC8